MPTVKINFDPHKKASEKSKGTVYIMVTANGVRKYYNTGVRILASQWDDVKGVCNCDFAPIRNAEIDSMKCAVNCYLERCFTRGLPFDFDGLRAHLEGQQQDDSFIAFVEGRIDQNKKLRPNTIKAHKTGLRVLREFGKITNFSDLTAKNLEAYDEYLQSRYDKQSMVHFCHKVVKVYINHAIRAGHMDFNPYSRLPVSRGKSGDRLYLEDSEVRAIMAAKVPTASLEKVRDLFVFQCFTGLAYADLAKFDFAKVVEHDGKYILKDSRQKSSEDFYIVLLPQAVDVLRRHNFKLPVISAQQYNMRLKILAECAGLERKLTSHMGRHSFATLCINNGVPIEVLAQMMGHSDIRTTQIYAKIVNKTVENAFTDLERKIG